VAIPWRDVKYNILNNGWYYYVPTIFLGSLRKFGYHGMFQLLKAFHLYCEGFQHNDAEELIRGTEQDLFIDMYT
jgi:hypothetical protein